MTFDDFLPSRRAPSFTENLERMESGKLWKFLLLRKNVHLDRGTGALLIFVILRNNSTDFNRCSVVPRAGKRVKPYVSVGTRGQRQECQTGRGSGEKFRG